MKMMPPSASRRNDRGFTLVEMIGVLAVIAILASLLVPRIFQAINDSKVSNAAAACNTVKSAVNEIFGKKGGFIHADGVPITANTNGFQGVLLKLGYLEKPIDARIGTAEIQVIAVSGLAANSDPGDAIDEGDAGSGAFNLDGDADTANDIVNAAMLAQVYLSGVTVQDARDLSLRLDGKDLSTTDDAPGGDDLKGRVKYTVTAGVCEVAVYIAHR